MDPLAEVLQTLHLQSSILCRGRAWSPWGMEVYPRGEGHGADAAFHIVTKGRCLLEVEGIAMPPLELQAGDFVLLPQGNRHYLRDAPHSPAPPIAHLLPNAWTDDTGSLCFNERGTEDTETALVCGKFFFGDRWVNPILRALPAVLHVRVQERGATEWLQMTVAFMACEASSGRPGAETVISRLCDILLIQAVRAYIGRAPECCAFGGEVGDESETAGWLRALMDPQIGPVLQGIHRAPGAPWTVRTLAEQAAMSRSAFAARFTHLVGEPPLRYITRWRIHTAAHLRRTERVSQVAEAVGYKSEAAFRKAQKRQRQRSENKTLAGAI